MKLKGRFIARAASFSWATGLLLATVCQLGLPGESRGATRSDAALAASVAGDVDLKLLAVFGDPDGDTIDVAATGKGMLGAGGSATLTLKVPGTPLQGWVYLSGLDDPDNGIQFPKGDGKVRIVITKESGGVTTWTAVPVVYKAGGIGFVSRLDVTAGLGPGSNRIAISGWDLDHAEGATALAVYRDPSLPPRIVTLLDGADMAYYPAKPPLGPDTELTTFLFPPAGIERTARALLFVSGAEKGRGDEVFLFTGPGSPQAALADTDGDGRPDITNRGVKLTRRDILPLGNDPANAAGAAEAAPGATSLEEDALGVKRSGGGYGYGPEFDLFAVNFVAPADSAFVSFQAQSENPENGDSLTVFAAALVIERPAGVNPLPNIAVVKGVEPARGYAPLAVTYTATVTAEGGTEALRGVTLVDDPAGIAFAPVDADDDAFNDGDLDEDGLLDLGESWRFTAAWTWDEPGTYPDTVTASGTGAESGLPVDASASAVVTVLPRGSIGDFVWEDVDRDGVQDPGEPGIAGIGVALLDGDGLLVATATTDAGGLYLFTGLLPGSYRVTVTPPAEMEQTFDLDGTATPNTASLVLAEGAHRRDADFGYARRQPRPGLAIEKTVVPDLAWPGDRVTYSFTVRNTGDVNLTNVTVTDDVLGTIGVVASLPVGQSATLLVSEHQVPACGQFSTGYGASPCAGSTLTAAEVCSQTNTARAAEAQHALSAQDTACLTIKRFGEIGDFVWDDLDRDGAQDPGEPGIPGVIVRLFQGATILGVRVTDAQGYYLFGNLKDATYLVDPVGPAGRELTTANDPKAVALGIGQSYLLADFGYWRPVPEIAVVKDAAPDFGYLFAADVSGWPATLVPTPLAVTYTAVVTNPGDEPLLDVTLVDDPAAIVFAYLSGDADGDGKLDPGEFWTFTATRTYTEAGTYPDTVTARGTGEISGGEVTAEDPASVRAIGCGPCLGKVATLALRNTGATAATVEVIPENDKFGDAKAFSGVVQPGGVFSFGPLASAVGGFDGTLGTNITVTVNGAANTSIHTSCSQPIYPGQTWGSFVVVSGTSKQGGELCPVR